MNRIVVDEPTKSQLRGAIEPCPVFDTAGNRIGYFLPEEYVGYESPLTEDELNRIEDGGGGRPLADILRDLENRT